MEINFGIKKVWKDLAESKEGLKYFCWISALFVLASVFDVIIKVKIFSTIINMVLGSYFVLMINNIIHDRKPVLEDLGVKSDEDRNLFLIILQVLGIGIVYGIGLLIIGAVIFAILAGLFKLNVVTSAIIMIILLLPFLIIISFCNLLFAENLNLGLDQNIIS